MLADADDELPDSVCFPSIWRKSASAGGQLEQPSDVKSSTRTARGPSAVADALLILVVCAGNAHRVDARSIAVIVAVARFGLCNMNASSR